MFEVKTDNQPAKFLKKCEQELFDRIDDKFKDLKNNPLPSDSKKIIGENHVFRVRVGKYRILYRINYETRMIVIIKIDHREKVY